MIRKIIKIDEDKCNGCGACATACHEGAIHMVNGKARLLRDDYCDGLGNCLPVCPVGAISFEEREALAFDETAVQNTNSYLTNWPIQLQLTPVTAHCFDQANLLIAADCTAYAYKNFQEEFMKKHITLIGCPKLDDIDYSIKLTELIQNNDIKSVKILRMEVPCCSGIENAVKKALQDSGKFLPWQVITVSTEGTILD